MLQFGILVFWFLLNFFELEAQRQTNDHETLSTCGNIFSYRIYKNEKFAIVTLQNPDREKNVLKVHMSLGVRMTTNNYGSIDLFKSKEQSVIDVTNGNPLMYKVRFPLQDPLPQPTAIDINDQLLCSGPKVNAPQTTNINLEHTFTIISPESNYIQQQGSPNQVIYRPETTTQWIPPPTTPKVISVQQTTDRPSTVNVQQTTRPPSIYVQQETTSPASVYVQQQTTPQPVQVQTGFECGVPNIKTPFSTGLIVNGKNAIRGQFPWLAAYYHNGVGDNGFICGGSLISTKLVITAAHCVLSKQEYSPRKAEEATFYLGKYNIDLLSEQYFVMSPVLEFVIHPDWDSDDDRYDADIAIAVLTRTVAFNKFIIPICLWTSTSNTNDLVGKTGVVAGWGKTEVNALTSPTPKWAEIPVVDLLTCIRSNAAFIQLTSDRTFCAGNKVEGSGPCNGDSGGGLIAKSGDKWYLRGIVSSSLYDSVQSSCDTKNFAVFTDVSKFTQWIQGFVQTYG